MHTVGVNRAGAMNGDDRTEGLRGEGLEQILRRKGCGIAD